MGTILVVYQSRHGHSADIAEHVAERVRGRALRATVLHVDVAHAVNLDLYDGVVVVSPVYFGGHSAKVMRFLRKRRAALAGVPLAFVSVENGAADADRAALANATRRMQRLVAETGVRADVMTAVGGAISYPRYGVGLRIAMKLHAFFTGAPTDTSSVHVLTDWNELDRTLAPFFVRIEHSAKATLSPDESGIHRILIEPGALAGPLDARGGVS